MSATFTLGAFAAIFDEHGSVLLCHRTDMDMWNAPGGRVDDGESPWDAVIREAKEETGLDVEVQKLHGVYAKDYENDIVFHFICKVIGGKITLNDEADQIEYFQLEDLPDNTHHHHLERIRDAYKENNKTLLELQSE